jgi:hypothetical protein
MFSPHASDPVARKRPDAEFRTAIQLSQQSWIAPAQERLAMTRPSLR